MKSSSLFTAVFYLCCLLILSACSSLPSHCTKLPGGAQYCLQDTRLGPVLELQQEVSISYQDKRETMIASIENDAKHLDFVGLTPFGQKILHMHYDNQLASARLTPDQRLSPALMLSLLQIALWPADAVQTGLDAGSKVVQQDQRRTIYHGEQLLMQVDYADLAVPYRHMMINLPPAKLQLDIRDIPDSQSSAVGLGESHD